MVNPEATATYRCVDPDLVLVGTGQLTCAFEGDMAVQWNPIEAPRCIEGKWSTWQHMIVNSTIVTTIIIINVVATAISSL